MDNPSGDFYTSYSVPLLDDFNLKSPLTFLHVFQTLEPKRTIQQTLDSELGISKNILANNVFLGASWPDGL